MSINYTDIGLLPGLDASTQASYTLDSMYRGQYVTFRLSLSLRYGEGHSGVNTPGNMLTKNPEANAPE